MLMNTYRYQAILAGVLVFVGLYPALAGATIYRCTTPGKPDSFIRRGAEDHALCASAFSKSRNCF